MIFAAPGVFAAPGDILFSDDFEDGTLAPWTTTNAAFSGVDNLTSSADPIDTTPPITTTNAGNSMFTFGIDVTVTSPQVNAATAGGVLLTAWVRKGHDDFSEDPDIATTEDLDLDYLNASGTWVTIQTFAAATLLDGEVVNVSTQLPADALHGLLQVRFHQLGGNGERGALPGWDVWHIDDVVLTETTASSTPTPLDLGVCDDFEAGLTNWTITSVGIAETNTLAPSLDNRSMSLYSDTVIATSPVIDTSTSFDGITLDVQRGSNTFSEYPDANEDLVIEYLNNALTWVNLRTYHGGDGQTAGEFFNDETFLSPPPAAAQHANFQLRLRLTDSSGNGVQAWDYWHIDDVCFVAIDADLSVTKSVAVEQDPVNGGAPANNPKAITGAYSIYTIDVSNTTAGLALNNSVVISDVLPAEVSLFVGDFDGSGSPFDFTDGAPSSGISYTFSSLNNAFDDVEFLDGGGSVIATVTPDVDGFANAVRQIRINTAGIFQANGSFSLEFRVRID